MYYGALYMDVYQQNEKQKHWEWFQLSNQFITRVQMPLSEHHLHVKAPMVIDAT